MARWRRPCVYLHTNKGAALADYICGRYGLEVPHNYEVPLVKDLPDTNDGLPQTWRSKYYTDGGAAWPARQMLSWGDAA